MSVKICLKWQITCICIMHSYNYLFLHCCSQKLFENRASIPLVIMQTFVMMAGELNYQENVLKPFLGGILPFPYLTYCIFVMFTFAVPILLINLMVSPKMLHEAIYLYSLYKLLMLHYNYILCDRLVWLLVT